MQHRTLGSRLDVSAIGLGCMGMSFSYAGADEDEARATLLAAVDAGVTLFDTAELYNRGNGSNEILLGEAVATFREEVQIATKFGFTYDEQGNSNGHDASPASIRRVTENSLRYLGADVIDVLYQHRQDPNVPVEDVAGTVKDLIEEGKVRYFGLSEVGPDTLRRAHAVHPICAADRVFALRA